MDMGAITAVSFFILVFIMIIVITIVKIMSLSYNITALSHNVSNPMGSHIPYVYNI